IAATDYVRAYPEQIRAFVPMRYTVLGTDGYGRSDTRENLRRHFEVSRNYIAQAAVAALAAGGKLTAKDVAKANEKYGIDAAKARPLDGGNRMRRGRAQPDEDGGAEDFRDSVSRVRKNGMGGHVFCFTAHALYGLMGRKPTRDLHRFHATGPPRLVPQPGLLPSPDVAEVPAEVPVIGRGHRGCHPGHVPAHLWHSGLHQRRVSQGAPGHDRP